MLPVCVESFEFMLEPKLGEIEVLRLRQQSSKNRLEKRCVQLRGYMDKGVSALLSY